MTRVATFGLKAALAMLAFRRARCQSRLMIPSPDLSRLVEIMAALRHPETGCPWDIEQDFASIAPFTIEEAHEVADAIRRGDWVDLKEELGDLLLQVVYHARLAEEAGHFALPDVIRAINTKMIRRHPHVFGGERAGSADIAQEAWAAIKAEEKAARAKARSVAGLPDDSPRGLLGNVSTALPAFARAVKLQQKAATVGFDWNDPRLVLDKIVEEAGEVREALDAGEKAEIGAEIGDLLFAVVNLARHAGIDPEAALAATNEKFTRRFGAVEQALAEKGRELAGASLEEMEALWQQAKGKR